MRAMVDVLTAHAVFAVIDGGWRCVCGEAPDKFADAVLHQAQALADAGYGKPRTITDWAELASLNMGVVRTSAGTIANIVDGRAYFFGYETSASVGGLGLPAVVLWEPTS